MTILFYKLFLIYPTLHFVQDGAPGPSFKGAKPRFPQLGMTILYKGIDSPSAVNEMDTRQLLY